MLTPFDEATEDPHEREPRHAEGIGPRAPQARLVHKGLSHVEEDRP